MGPAVDGGREDEEGELDLEDCLADADVFAVAAPAHSDEQRIPTGAESKYAAISQLPPTELRSMLKEMNAPLGGSKDDMAVRIVRVLVGAPPLAADAPHFEAIEAETAAKTARVLRKAVREAQGKGRGRGEGAPKEPRARKGPRKFKVVSERKVGVLGRPDVSLSAQRYLEPGAEFEVAEELVNPVDGRRYYRLKIPKGQAGRGWVPQCSRKDVSRVIVEELPPEPPPGDAPAAVAEGEADDQMADADAVVENADEAVADAENAGDAIEEAAPQEEAVVEPPQKLRRLKRNGSSAAAPAPETQDVAAQQTSGKGKSRGRSRSLARTAAAQPEEQADTVADEGAAAEYIIPKPEELPEGWLPPGSEAKYLAYVDFQPAELRSMLQHAEAPLDGARHELAVRLIRALAGLPPTKEDERMFEARRKRVALENAGMRHPLADLSRFEFEAAVEEFVEGADLQHTKLGDLNRALEAKFGELPAQALLKAREMATRSIVRRARLKATTEQMMRRAQEAADNPGAFFAGGGRKKGPRGAVAAIVSGSGFTDDEGEEAAADAPGAAGVAAPADAEEPPAATAAEEVEPE
eukprot:TRINITY_DN47634_c0_g1_i1.p1 TRINITY_DN47634_c0_g1~~TRINITY_DN47634_c0_g1_i1.p1  ORF type:complete len:581 (+),score=123.33 TRINITY_DN47634_c0_g1_i1:86-1828(+)